MRSILVVALSVFLAFSTETHAGSITITSATTPSEELAQAVERALEALTENPGESSELILEGDFAPTETITIQWWGEAPLTVSGSARIDGSHLSRESEVVFLAGNNFTLTELHFVEPQGHAVVVGGGSEKYAIRSCVFEDCRRSAIHVWNDPHTVHREEDRRGVISDNRVSRFNLEDAKWANDAITVFDQRVTISNNVISDSPTECNGIRAMGRDLTIERNVVRGVSRDDAAGIYLWGGPHASLFRGNLVRWNHVIGASRGIYLDDGTSGAIVEENVVEDSSFCAIFLSGGRDNVVRGNVVSQTPVFVHLDSRCLGWDSRPEYAALAEESLTRLRDALAAEPGASRLRKRYPALASLNEADLTLEAYGQPKANRVYDNFVRGADEIWELMDFSIEVTTDFIALNDFAEPEPIDEEINLNRVHLGEQFGFDGWARLQELGEAELK